jgi:predicted nicotinamide N-methyase
VSSRAAILAETVIEPAWLCPEIRLRLITERCRLWRSGERELELLGWPAPYWAFAWAGGQALARHLLDHPEHVRGRRVLAFGAGGGVEAIAAAKAGASAVLASDIDPVALEALALNAALNGVAIDCTARDLIGDPLTGIEVVLAADVFYDREIAGRVVPWLQSLAARGALALLADPERGFMPGDPSAYLAPEAERMAPADGDPGGRYLRMTRIWRVQRPPDPR